MEKKNDAKASGRYFLKCVLSKDFYNFTAFDHLKQNLTNEIVTKLVVGKQHG